MVYLEHQPAPPLSSFVQAFWYTRGYLTEHRRERILPNGSIQVVISLAREYIIDCLPVGDVRLPPAAVAGVHSRFLVVDTADMEEMIGVQFWPGGFSPCCLAPADHFTNAHVALDDLWPREAGILRARLAEAPGPGAKFAVLESVLKARLLRSPLTPPAAVEYAIRTFRLNPRVSAVTAQLGMSERRFAQVFREHVGVNPKVYCRIQRFQQAVRQIRAGNRVDWAALALSCGYYDQSHFANDFRGFSGMTPVTYQMAGSPWLNHVAIHS